MACDNDRHVTDKVKHETKHPFIENMYGADLNEVMNQSARSMSGDSFNSTSRKASKRGKGLLRKMSTKIGVVSQTLDAFNETVKSSKKKRVKKQSTEYAGGFGNNPSDSIVTRGSLKKNETLTSSGPRKD